MCSSDLISLEEATAQSGGGKADGARRLAMLAGRTDSDFATPASMVVPFGVMEAALDAAPEIKQAYQELLRRMETLNPEKLSGAAEQMRTLIGQLRVPPEINAEVARRFGPSARLMVRSSANCEDLEALAGAGLHESFGNVTPAEVGSAIRKVWASLWTRRATLSRQQAGINHEQAHMAVLIQQLVTPEYCFVLHTVNPVSRNAREVYAELAVGLGETLASANIPGSPYRLVIDKETGDISTLALASFSVALAPAPSGVLCRKLDYSTVALTCDSEARLNLGKRLGNLAGRVEQEFGAPQDIEGAVVGNEIYLVQSRPQVG